MVIQQLQTEVLPSKMHSWRFSKKNITKNYRALPAMMLAARILFNVSSSNHQASAPKSLVVTTRWLPVLVVVVGMARQHVNQLLWAIRELSTCSYSHLPLSRCYHVCSRRNVGHDERT